VNYEVVNGIYVCSLAGCAQEFFSSQHQPTLLSFGPRNWGINEKWYLDREALGHCCLYKIVTDASSTLGSGWQFLFTWALPCLSVGLSAVAQTACQTPCLGPPCLHTLSSSYIYISIASSP
jgi:hypothetical protein